MKFIPTGIIFIILLYSFSFTQVSAEELAAHAEAEANAWKGARVAAYPSTGDQFDMQYHDSVNGTTTWADAIAQVKSDNPKG